MSTPVLTRRTVLQAAAGITAAGAAWSFQPATPAVAVEPVVEAAASRFVLVGLL